MGATNCPETPRQKMITMMYLVYTAMLALNVSAEVVEGFRSVGSAMTQSNINLQTKIDDTYANFDVALENSRDKVQESYDKAQQVKNLSRELEMYIDSLEYEFIGKLAKDEVTVIVDKKNPKSKEGRRTIKIKNPDGSVNPDSVRLALHLGGFSWMEKGLDDTHEAPKFFLKGSTTADGVGAAYTLKEKVITYRQKVKEILGEDSSKVNFPFDVDETFLNKEKIEVPWEEKNFEEVVAGAGLVTLIRMKADAMNAEFDAVNMLYKQVDKGDFKFDQVRMISRPKTTYIIQGQRYETDINVAAYDSHQEFYARVNGQEIHSNDSGSVHYTTICNNVGPQKVTGVAYVTNPDGGTQEYPISDSYFVAKPVAVVSLDKMQVVYVGVDNPLTVSVPGVDGRNVTATVDGGATLQKVEGDGAYILRTNGSAKKISIRVEAKIDNKVQLMGVQEVRVKQIPTPVIKLAGYKTGDKVSKKQIAEGSRIIASRPEGFDFELPKGAMQVKAIEVYISNKQYQTTGDRLAPDMYSAIRKAQKGDMINVDATVQMPDGKPIHAYCQIQLKN